MNDLLKFYTHLLTSLGYVIEDGYVYIVVGANDKQQKIHQNIKIGDKVLPLVLPTAEILKELNLNEDAVAFHPACESRFKGQSEILNMLVVKANMRLMVTMQQTITAIIDAASDPKIQRTLNKRQNDLFIQLPKVTKPTLRYLNKVFKKTTGITGTRRFLGLHLSRGGELGTVHYDRICTFNTPIQDAKQPLYGIEDSITAQRAFSAALDIVIPENADSGNSDNNTPYLIALLTTYSNVAKHLNGIRNILGKLKGGTNHIDVAWFDDLVNLSAMAKDLPQTLPGNAGSGIKEESSINEPVTNPVVVAAVPVEEIIKEPTVIATTNFRSSTVKAMDIPVPTTRSNIVKTLTPVAPAPVSNVMTSAVNPAVAPAMTPEMMMNNMNSQAHYQVPTHTPMAPIRNRPTTRSDLYR